MKYTAIFVLFLTALFITPSLKAEELKLPTKDRKEVFATFTEANSANDKIVILFHQARSNRHEYDPIISAINELGFDTLATDQRSGGTMWGEDNLTVKAAGDSTKYPDAFPDLQAAVDWAVKKGYKTIVTVGSSYSSALNFFLAKKNRKNVTAMASFSPGEYLGRDWHVAGAAKGLKIPVYVTSGSDAKEVQHAAGILSDAGLKKLTLRKPENGVHGASTLREDRNAKGWKDNLDHFLSFLKSVK